MIEEPHLAGGQQLEVGPGVPAPVAVHPLQPQPGGGGRGGGLQAVGEAAAGHQEAHRPAADEDAEHALVLTDEISNFDIDEHANLQYSEMAQFMHNRTLPWQF